MGKRVTIHDIAKYANVSVGTVSKYLNRGTDYMKEENIIAISRAIEELGYTINKAAQTLARKPVKIGVLLPTTFDDYYFPMQEGIERAVERLADFKVSAVFERFAGYYDDGKVIEVVQKFITEQVDGIILAPTRFCNFTEIVKDIKRANIPIMLVVSDLPKQSRLACVGVDALLSGEIAADLAEMTMDPKSMCAVFVGDKEISEHRDKANSFRDKCEEYKLNVLGIYETQDDPEIAYQVTSRLLKVYSNLRLIYVATGNSVAVCQAIVDLDKQNIVKVIATDIPRELRSFAQRNIVIGALRQHLHEQGTVALESLYTYLSEGTLKNDVIRIKPELMTRSALLSATDS